MDTQGNILHVEVHGANIHDAVGGILSLRSAYEKFPSIIAVCGEAGYRSIFEGDAKNWDWKWILWNVRSQKLGKFCQNAGVERTFTWLGNYRRLSKDYEFMTSSEVAFIQVAHIHILLKGLSKIM